MLFFTDKGKSIITRHIILKTQLMANKWNKTSENMTLHMSVKIWHWFLQRIACLTLGSGEEETWDSTPGSGRSPARGNGNPLQYSSLKKSHGQRSLATTVHGGHKKSDMAEQLSVRVHQTKLILKSWFCHEHAEWLSKLGSLCDLFPDL